MGGERNLGNLGQARDLSPLLLGKEKGVWLAVPDWACCYSETSLDDSRVKVLGPDSFWEGHAWHYERGKRVFDLC